MTYHAVSCFCGAMIPLNTHLQIMPPGAWLLEWELRQAHRFLASMLTPFFKVNLRGYGQHRIAMLS